MKRHHLWLCMPPAIMCLIDHAVTTLHQPPRYWEGDYAVADERNPLVFWIMTQHPLAYLILPLIWIGVFSAVVVCLPRMPAVGLALMITYSHAFMTGTWLYRYQTGFWLALGMCLLSTVLMMAAFHLWDRANAPAQADSSGEPHNRHE